MKITGALRGEHGALYTQFDYCEAELARHDPAGVRRVAALLGSALAPHAHIEDELLFDEVDARLGEPADVLEIMRQEHNEIEALLARIAATEDDERARELLIDVIDAARRHFEKEERVGFPLAETVMSEAELTSLGLQWAKARGVIVEVEVS